MVTAVVKCIHVAWVTFMSMMLHLDVRVQTEERSVYQEAKAKAVVCDGKNRAALV